jgi:hypothetical protein
MDIKYIFIIILVIEINRFKINYGLCNKLHNFGTCKHHITKYINSLFMKLIILF